MGRRRRGGSETNFARDCGALTAFGAPGNFWRGCRGGSGACSTSKRGGARRLVNPRLDAGSPLKLLLPSRIVYRAGCIFALLGLDRRFSRCPVSAGKLGYLGELVFKPRRKPARISRAARREAENVKWHPPFLEWLDDLTIKQRAVISNVYPLCFWQIEQFVAPFSRRRGYVSFPPFPIRPSRAEYFHLSAHLGPQSLGFGDGGRDSSGEAWSVARVDTRTGSLSLP